MKIAGLQKLSLVDFPGYLAAAVFVQGCNFRCGYCQNPDLVTCNDPLDFPESEILDYLKLRKNIIEGVVISGGEPTIYNDLPDLIRRIKEVDEALKIKLDTNGSNPQMLEKLLEERLLDYLAIDMKTSLEKYHLLTDRADIGAALAESIRLAMLSNIPYEFRITCVPGIVDEKDISGIALTVKGAEKCCLQQFRPVMTYDRAYQKVKPYMKNDLERFRGILLETVKNVEIRGV